MRRPDLEQTGSEVRNGLTLEFAISLTNPYSRSQWYSIRCRILNIQLLTHRQRPSLPFLFFDGHHIHFSSTNHPFPPNPTSTSYLQHYCSPQVAISVLLDSTGPFVNERSLSALRFSFTSIYSLRLRSQHYLRTPAQ